MAFELTSYLEEAKQKINEWVRDDNHVPFDPTPLSVEQIKTMKIGTPCYLISRAGIRIGMYSGGTERSSDEWDKPGCGDATIILSGGSMDCRCKVKNANKTYVLLKAIPGLHLVTVVKDIYEDAAGVEIAGLFSSETKANEARLKVQNWLDEEEHEDYAIFVKPVEVDTLSWYEINEKL